MLWFIAEIFLFLVVAGVCFWLFGWWARGKFMGNSNTEAFVEQNEFDTKIRQMNKNIDDEQKRAMKSEGSIEGKVTELTREAKVHFSSSHKDTVYDDAGLKSQIMALKNSFGGGSKEYDDSGIRKDLRTLTEDMANLNKACKEHFTSSHADTVFNDSRLVERINDLTSTQRELEAKLKQSGDSYNDSEIRKVMATLSQKQVSLEDRIMDHEKKPHDQKTYDDREMRSMFQNLEKSQKSLSDQINKHANQPHDFKQYDDSNINREVASITSSLQKYAKELEAVNSKVEEHRKIPHSNDNVDAKVVAIDKKTSKLQDSQEMVRQALMKIEEALAKLEASYKSQKKQVRVAKPRKVKKEVKRLVNRRPDDLTVIKGIGKVIQGKLRRFGVKYYEQIAEWTSKDIKVFDEKLSFKGRIRRESWVVQARKLSANREKLKKAS